jgi:hypothetical protein
VLFTSIYRESHAEDYIEIRNRTDSKLVTLIDVLSPANKTTLAGKTAYLDTRTASLLQRCGTVEIDLITQGKPPLDFDRSGLPPCHFTVTVTRPATPERYEVYASLVRNRLPKFKVPLAADDRDTVLDLQAAFQRAYESTVSGTSIDYKAPLPPDVAFDADARAWIAEWLTKNTLS